MELKPVPLLTQVQLLPPGAPRRSRNSEVPWNQPEDIGVSLRIQEFAVLGWFVGSQPWKRSLWQKSSRDLVLYGPP